jgi:glycosyltransferase involved in cell wall biosynthesis
MPASPAPVAVVIATRNRGTELLGTLTRLRALREQPPIVVVDNGSTDGTAELVRANYPGVRVVGLRRNQGGAARTVGARLVDSPYVAFSDDDSWWAPGALGRAAELLERHPRLAVLAARVLVGPDERLDPVCREMARSPLPSAPDLPGPSVLGFIACGAVVRPRPLRPPPGPGPQRPLVGLAAPAAGRCGQTDRPPGRPRHAPARSLVGHAPGAAWLAVGAA